MVDVLARAALLTIGLACSAKAEHYHVYLLGGQSNANGRGDAAQLTAPLASPQPDVRFYWHRTQATTNVGWLLEDQWIDLAPGSGHGTTSPVHAREFGSELSFGRAMADAVPAARIAIIKYSHGGTNLYSEWSATGDKYATFVATVQTALASLTTASHTYELGGMIWHQGEADTGAQADSYEANLTSLVNRVRNDIFAGQPAPFVIGSLSNSQYGSQITTAGTGPYKVRQAQQAVAANMPNVGFVNTDGYTTRPGEAIHFDHVGQISLGQDFASEMLRLGNEDTDQDGLYNGEEITLGTDPTKADTDGDGQDDGFEVLGAGTDPLSGTSFFGITGFAISGHQVSLTWPSAPGNRYAIETSTDLANWSTLASNHPAADPGSATTWTGTPGGGGAGGDGGGILALYDAESGLNGDFNTSAFDSVDTDRDTTATRLSQGGSLTGGGANLFVLNRDLDKPMFDGSSDSGWPAFNCSGVNTSNQAAAATAGDFFSFTIQGGGVITAYESLSFHGNQYGTTARIDVSCTIGAGSEVFVARNMVPIVNNVPVTLQTIDFPDFTSTEDIKWTFYIFGSSDSTHGVRFDDIRLSGCRPASVIANFTFTGPPWTAAKEADFATFAANAPSVDTDLNSSTSLLSNSGYTSGGYFSYYVRDIDGGTVGVEDAADFKIFSTSTTPGVGMNVGGANTTTPTHYVAFTVTPDAGQQTTFKSLSFYTDTNGATDAYNIQLRAWDGATETTLGAVSNTATAMNSPVVFKLIDFADFTTTSATEFRLYGYNVASSTGGIRYDDIKLFGSTQSGQTGSTERAFFRVRLLP